MMGGRIWVESERRRGSTFHFTVRVGVDVVVAQRPLAETSDIASPIADVAPRADRAPLRLLLAEDNDVNQRIGVAMLRRLGHAVLVVENGRDAVEAVRTRRLRRRADGRADAGDERLRRDPGDSRASSATPAATCHIVALTAHAMEGDRTRCLEAGMDDYLTKPLTIAALIAVLDRVAADRGIADSARQRPRPPYDH